MEKLGQLCGFLFALGCGLLTFASGVGHLGMFVALCGSICTFIINFKISYQDAPRFYHLLFDGEYYLKYFITSEGGNGNISAGQEINTRSKIMLAIGAFAGLMMGIAYSILVYAGVMSVIANPAFAMLIASGTFVAVLGMDVGASVSLAMKQNPLGKSIAYCIKTFTHKDEADPTLMKVIASLLNIVIIGGGLTLSVIGLWYATYAGYAQALATFAITGSMLSAMVFVGILILPFIAQIPFMLQTTMATLNPDPNTTIGMGITRLAVEVMQTLANEFMTVFSNRFFVIPGAFLFGVAKLCMKMLAYLAGGRGGMNVMQRGIEQYFYNKPITPSNLLRMAYGGAVLCGLVVLQCLARLVVYLPGLIVLIARAYNALGNGEVARANAETDQKDVALVTATWLSFCFAANGDADPYFREVPSILPGALDIDMDGNGYMLVGDTEDEPKKAVSQAFRFFANSKEQQAMPGSEKHVALRECLTK